MGVTIEGVKGYEYQYKISLLASLKNKEYKVSHFIENHNHEDSYLIIPQNNQINLHYEIQVKSEKGALDFKKLIGWLCHFNNRSDNYNLLQSLLDNENYIALFITQTRCSDDTLKYKSKNQEFHPHIGLDLKKRSYKDFINVLSKLNFGKTNMMVNRSTYCEQQAKNLSKEKLASVLRRVIIWDEIDENELDNSIQRILNQEFSISESKCKDVFLNAIELIKQGRDEQNEVHEKILSHLRVNRIGAPKINHEYRQRAEEHFLHNTIEQEKVLLLSGISFCGKSDLAKKIASTYYLLGYDYCRSSDIIEIERFFLSNIKDKKIAILEDPWGHLDVKTNYYTNTNKIKDLISNKEQHHLLIITSREEIILKVFDCEKVNNIKINNNHNWVNLTISNNEIINKYWLDLASEAELDEEIIQEVSEGISKTDKEHLLQIGELVQLTKEDSNNLVNKSFNEIIHFARKNSQELAQSIQEKNATYADFISTLSLCCDAIKSISKIDLSYILDLNSSPLSITQKKVFSSSLTGSSQPQYPSYSNSQITSEHNEAIDYFEERGFIETDQNHILFKHPSYLEVGRYLLKTRSKQKQKNVLKRLENTIFSTSPINALLGIEQLCFLYFKLDNPFKKQIIEIAFEALDSIYPSIEDNALIFLISIIDDLEKIHLDKLIPKIQR